MLSCTEEKEAPIVMNPRFLTESEVAERTQISLATLRRWRLENRGPKYRKFGSLVRYPEEELGRWEQTQPSGGSDAIDRATPQHTRNVRNTRSHAKSARNQAGGTAATKVPNGTGTATRPNSDAVA